MGMWTGIKKALNSTLGTKAFKPLNQLVDDTLWKYTLGSKQYVASDVKIIQYINSHTQIKEDGSACLGTFTPAVGGYIRFNYKIISYREYGKMSIIVKNLTQNVVVFSQNTYSDSPTINGQQLFSDIYIQPGNLYRIDVSYTNRYPDGSQGRVENVFISGTISEALLYSYTIGG